VFLDISPARDQMMSVRDEELSVQASARGIYVGGEAAAAAQDYYLELWDSHHVQKLKKKRISTTWAFRWKGRTNRSTTATRKLEPAP